MMKATTHKKVLLTTYIVGIILLLCWLFSSNHIVTMGMDQQLEKFDIKLSMNANEQGSYCLDRFSSHEGLLEVVEFEGWAFGYNSGDNQDRETYLVFQSDKQSYMVKCETTEREALLDVVSSVFPEEVSTYSEYLGFGAFFSTATMKDDIYTLSILCKENENETSLLKTNKMYQKTGAVFEEFIWKSEQVTPFENGLIQPTIHMDSIAFQNARIQVNGWAFVKDCDSAQQEVYVQIENDTQTLAYTTQQIARPDVANACSNDLYTDSGFHASIPVDELTAGTYTVTIVVKYGDQIGMQQNATITVAEDGTVTIT